jgi:ABC-2 type transport system ATP-binding protein
MDEAEYCNRLALIYRGKLVALGSPTELKRSSMKGDLLLLECDRLGEAVQLLEHAPGVMDAAVFGNALHLVVDQAASATPQLTQYLAQRNIKVERLERIHASLEDVFVALTTERASGKQELPQ